MKRSGAPLTDNEKLMIINVYNYFSEENSRQNDHRKLTLRKWVAEILGVAEGTVESVVSDWNSRGDNTFTPHKVLGRPKSEPDENIAELLRTKILDANKKAEQLNTPILRQKTDMNFRNGSFFGYYIVWAIISAKESVEIFFMSHQIMLHTVAVISDPNLLSVRNTLLDAFKKKITSQVIIGFWRRALKNAKEYLESDEDAQLMDDEFDEYSNSDDDHVT